MIPLASTGDLLNKAFNLACFILGDRDAALRVVRGALAKLEVATAAQSKRLYYRPTGRLWSRHSQSSLFRNNISFNQPHLLQRLIYIESEPYEVAQEQAKGPATVGEEDLVIHFIKHLTKKTIKRNSFYVTLGLTRLLYSYTTAETMDIYNAVIQDPARVKDDYYCRSRKGVLMQELKQRFGDLIHICRGPRGEERFQADDNQSRFVELVRECLSFFTPWQTPCLVPAGINPITDGIPSFSYQGQTEEDKIEVNRIHALLHPDCFKRLTADLRFDAPDTRLDIPRFFYANDMNNNGLNDNRRRLPKLNEQERISIKGELDRNAARRKATHATPLRIMVDGIERARIDLKSTATARFHLDNAELIEVRSLDKASEEVLLASHLLSEAEPDDRVRSSNTSITLEGGQKISIVVSPEPNENGGVVDISYRETNPLRPGSLLIRQLASRLSSGTSRSAWKNRRILVPVLTLVLLVISFGVIVKFIRKGNVRETEQNPVVTSQPNGQISEEKTVTPNNGTTAPAGESRTSRSSTTAPQRDFEARRQSEREGSPPKAESADRNSTEEKTGVATVPGTVTEGETRSTRAARASTPLSAVKKVFIEVTGDETLRQSVRQMLSERLRTGKRISPVNNRNEADALLQVTVLRTPGAEPDKVNILVELINPRGNLIWTGSGSKYEGSLVDVSASIARDLLAAIQKSKRQE